MRPILSIFYWTIKEAQKWKLDDMNEWTGYREYMHFIGTIKGCDVNSTNFTIHVLQH